LGVFVPRFYNGNRGLFGDIFSFKIKVGVYEKLAKTEGWFYETFGLRSKVAGVTCIFMNERHGALAPHGYACWLQPAATRPSPHISSGRLFRCFIDLYEIAE